MYNYKQIENELKNNKNVILVDKKIIDSSVYYNGSIIVIYNATIFNYKDGCIFLDKNGNHIRKSLIIVKQNMLSTDFFSFYENISLVYCYTSYWDNNKIKNIINKINKQ